MQSKEAFWDDASFLSELIPVIIRCDNDDWQDYFDNYTLIDAVSISLSELVGTDYEKRAYYKPAWLEDAERTNALVLTRLDRVPVNSDDPSEKTQVSFMHLIRGEEEDDAARELSFGSGIFVPRSLRVFIILPSNYNPFFSSRCALLTISP